MGSGTSTMCHFLSCSRNRIIKGKSEPVVNKGLEIKDRIRDGLEMINQQRISVKKINLDK